nr:MAG TPA_asm: hypothetical protein [Caudoviricetes sp.]
MLSINLVKTVEPLRESRGQYRAKPTIPVGTCNDYRKHAVWRKRVEYAQAGGSARDG